MIFFEAAERAEDLVQQLKGTAVSWEERLTQLEKDLQHSKESVGTLREMVETEPHLACESFCNGSVQGSIGLGGLTDWPQASDGSRLV